MLKKYLNSRKKAISYLKNHPEYNAMIHGLGGVAIGILIFLPFVNPHPIRWALVFAGLSIAGHLYPLIVKK